MTAPAVARDGAPRRVCFFGTYARNHTANVLLREAFVNLGWTVDEVHLPLWEETRDKLPQYFAAGSLVGLAAAYFGKALRLAPRLLRQHAHLYVAGFNGQLDAILMRLVRWRAPVLFAPLVSITETLVDDRHIYLPQSVAARLVKQVDRHSLRSATRVLIDTEAHRRYLIDKIGAAADRTYCWYLGADTRVFRPYGPRPAGGPVRVLFYGQFLPLHGVDVILQAMASLATDSEFEFTVVGTGPERRRVLASVPRQAFDRLRLIEWVSYEQLGELIAGADLCLGTFGVSPKARMVIPNKVYQAAAVGRAILTADTPALREVFTPGREIAVCPPGNSEALVEGIRALRREEAREQLATNARQLMATRFSRQAQAASLHTALGPMVSG